MALEWHWVPDRKPGPDAPSLAERFPSQGEAETWLGETYPDLLAGGVTAVSLHQGDRRVYGPMSLEADAG